MQHEIGMLNSHSVDATLAMHTAVAHVYEETWNAHTFDFEQHVGRFLAPDITVVMLGAIEGRSLLRDISDARAAYIRDTQAKVTISEKVRCVTDLGTTVVAVAESDYRFRYPDQTSQTLRVISSSVVRRLGDTWVFQHVHFGTAVRPTGETRGIFI